MNLSEMKIAKKEMGLSCETIAARTKVPLSTVQKIFSGVTKRPREETLRQLSTVFIRYDHTIQKPGGMRIGEPAVDYGKSLAQEPAFEPGSSEPFRRQGTYTVEDYYRVPDDRRVELIDGVFYDMSAPNAVHQHIVGFIFNQIYNYIQSNNGDCIPFCAPTDVRLDIFKDDKTMVQPDVFVICDEEKVNYHNVTEGPDFIVEVLSPSTRRKDMIKKLQKYADADVREYWIVDPQNAKITVYDFENDCDMKVYRFGEKVPVAIYDGKLVIDFDAVPKYIKKMYNDNWELITD